MSECLNDKLLDRTSGDDFDCAIISIMKRKEKVALESLKRVRKSICVCVQGVVIRDRHRCWRTDPPSKTLSLTLQGPEECDGVVFGARLR